MMTFRDLWDRLNAAIAELMGIEQFDEENPPVPIEE
jgi:hypothetical protein